MSSKTHKHKIAKQPKHKKVKNRDKTDRLIARMILGFNLTLTVATGVHCAVTHPNIDDLRDSYTHDLTQKEAYLDAYEQTDEFKNQYNDGRLKLNSRLIAREINGETYDKELKYMESNTYTEKVLMQTASEQMKNTYNKLNQQYLDSKEELDKTSVPFMLGAYGMIGFPLFGVYGYNIYNPKKKKRHLDLDIDDAEHHISEESFESVMELEDMPYQGDDYIPHSKGNEDTQKYMPFYVEKHGIIRMLNNEDIEEENENRLGTRYYDANSMTIKNTNGTKEDEQSLSK